MSKLKTWKELEKELDFTPEETAQMEIEMDIIKATIKARKERNLTQRKLSDLTGIKQPSIAKLESMNHSPQMSTVIKILYSMGYTLEVVPINKKKLIMK